MMMMMMMNESLQHWFDLTVYMVMTQYAMRCQSLPQKMSLVCVENLYRTYDL